MSAVMRPDRPTASRERIESVAANEPPGRGKILNPEANVGRMRAAKARIRYTRFKNRKRLWRIHL